MLRRVLVMSSERTGSNLLRSMLDAHSALHGPPPAHFTNALRGHYHLYGDLADDAALRRAAEDVCALTGLAAEPWAFRPSVEEVLAAVTHRSVWGLVDAVFRSAATAAGKSGWVDKDNDLFDHALAMAEAMPGLRVLHLVRDGRDVACSVLKAPFGPKHVYPIAQQWKREQVACLRVHHALAPRGACTRVHYERLIADPEGELRRICAFLDLDFEPPMLAFHQRGQAAKTAGLSPYWSNLSRPVMAKNAGKYLRELSARQIELFEGVAGPELAVLGYPLHGPPIAGARPSRLQRRVYRWLSARGERRAAQGVEEKVDRAGRQRALRAIRDRVVARALAQRNGKDDEAS